MSRYDHVVRVVRLVQRLTEDRAGVTVRGVAGELGVHERTARRYLKALEEAGFPLDLEAGRFRLPRTAATRLSSSDERALLMSAIASYPLGGTPLLPKANDLITRFGSRLPRQEELFSRLSLPLSAPSRLSIDYSRHEAHLRTLLKAIDERTRVRAAYFTAGRNEETRRDLDPYSFYYDASLETLYLFAWCHLRKSMRTFAAHRFRMVRLLRKPFVPDPTFTVESHLANAFRLYRGQQAMQLRIRFEKHLAPRIAERTWHRSQKQIDLEGGAIELQLQVDGTEEVLPWVLSHGKEAKVLAPQEFAEQIREAHREAAGRYGEAEKRGGSAGRVRGGRG